MTEAETQDIINRMTAEGMEKLSEAGVYLGDWVRYAMSENGELTITRVPPEEIYVAPAPPHKPSQE
jgi:hypothetical protein